MTHRQFMRPRWIWCLLTALLLGGMDLGGAALAATTVPGMTVFDGPAGAGMLGPIVGGADGNLWFVEYTRVGAATVIAKIARITPMGAITEYPLPDFDRSGTPTYDENYSALAAGPDGNVWFTDAHASRVGRITPDGTISEFPVPTPNSGLAEITTGPDGNLWFLEEIGYTPGATGPTPLRSKIVRMSTAGVATEFETVGELHSIIAAPDGNLYVMNQGSQTFLRVTPAGIITPIPQGYAGAYGIAVGPDGNLWTAYWSSCRPNPDRCNLIDRITLAGAVTAFNPPDPPNGIATGADGNLWFSTFGPLVGRITPAGAITMYAPPTGVGETRSIAAGPDNNLWIVTAANKLIRLEPTTVVPSQTIPPPASAACAPFAPDSAFAAPGFGAQWRQGEAITPNFWGPTVTGALHEPYVEAAGGQRLVQYFDKGRMELANPATGAVTNGLLATELLTGTMQTGDQTFQQRSPSGAAIAGDPDDLFSPTYVQINGMAEIRRNAQPTIGLPTTRATVLVRSIGDTRMISTYGAGANDAHATIMTYDDATSHNVPAAFASYRDRAGIATIGYAITEPFWADVKVGGAQKQVLVQIFQRRVLTYTPDNPRDYRVEMGNVGQHYYRWRNCIA